VMMTTASPTSDSSELSLFWRGFCLVSSLFVVVVATTSYFRRRTPVPHAFILDRAPKSKEEKPYVFFLTGCASGIGLHLTNTLLKKDGSCLVIATDINETGMREQASKNDWPSDRVLIHSLDVRSPENWNSVISNALERFGQIDVLINIAGYLKPAHLLDVSIEDIHRHIDINTKGSIFGTRLVAEHMKHQTRRGHIINFASLASLSPVSGLDLYSSSKFAVRAFSLAAATSLENNNIDLTVVSPDAVETPMLDLQLDYKECALSFSGTPLTVADIEQSIFQNVLLYRPLEVWIPMHRGWLAALSSYLPRSILHFSGILLEKRGLSLQANYRQKRDQAK